MSKTKKIKSIGLIVEDNSDFESLKAIIGRVINKDSLTFKKAIGHGCGKMKRKAAAYVDNLSRKGCDLIILVHDLDRNDLATLQKELTQILSNSTVKNKFICIPIEELEGWFLGDPQGIKDVFQLNRIPKINGSPHDINSPKEKLEDLVFECSDKSKRYINTKHNILLSNHLDLEKISKKCNSFRELEQYITKFKY